jgi:ferrous-iron efflux pump FieF
LVLFKFGAWIANESLSLLSTLIDSLLYVGASFIHLLAVRHALVPADKDHRFGHGKAELLAGLAQAASISGSALFILFEAGAAFCIRVASSIRMLALVLWLFP